MLSDGTLAFGELLAPALLGVDALYRAESGSRGDGLVVVNMAADTHRPEPFSSYTEANERFSELERLSRSLSEADRRLYYAQVCQSTRTFIRWRQGFLDSTHAGGELSFPDQLAGFLHVPAIPVTDDQLDMLRADLRALLTGMDYLGDLGEQCASWEQVNRVPADEVLGTIAELADQAWDRTSERIDLPAPKSDGMRFEGVSGVGFNARCSYLDRTVELNIDPVLTRPALKHLVVHECYPGHYVQFKLREEGYRRGIAPADGLLSVVNTASSSPFEGIADNGLRVIDWIASDDDRVSAIMNRYRAAIGTGAAWRLHALGWTETRVAKWLRDHTLVGGEGWVENRMRFIAHPARAVLIWSYWWGEACVAPAWERVLPAQRRGFLDFLYERMHSPQTVAMFA